MVVKGVLPVATTRLRDVSTALIKLMIPACLPIVRQPRVEVNLDPGKIAGGRLPLSTGVVLAIAINISNVVSSRGGESVVHR